ncbi:hypothetical protein Saa2_08713 [Streptomyces acidiscabies]|nr:hypothetical protein Saa2_08713 [Streptomyces acidiscabies]
MSPPARVNLNSPCRVTAAPYPSASPASMPDSRQRPLCRSSLCTERSSTGTSSGNPGSSRCPRTAPTAVPSASSAVITSTGTDTAASNIAHSRSSASDAYVFPGSSEASYCPLTTNTPARSTTSGHRTVDSASDSGRCARNASTAGSTDTGPAPWWCSTDVQVTASSDTAQPGPRSPKSMTPTGIGRPSAPVSQTTLLSVRSPWITCTGRLSAYGSTVAQAARAAAVTRAARSWSAMRGASASITSAAYDRSHSRPASGSTGSAEASAVTTRPASSPRRATTGGAR